jgi:hypothetical protein
MPYLVLFEHANFQGEKITFDVADGDLTDDALSWFLFFQTKSWNDQASSMIVDGEPLIIYKDIWFNGMYKEFQPGTYSYLGDEWNDTISSFKFDMLGEWTSSGPL